MAATVKGGAGRNRPAPEPAEPEIIALDDEGETAEPERVPVFSIGGTVYTMLADPPANIVLRAMDVAEQRGGTEIAVGLADVWIMREMLGEEAYRALLNAKNLTRQQYIAIVTRVMKAAMGSLEDEGRPNR